VQLKLSQLGDSGVTIDQLEKLSEDDIEQLELNDNSEYKKDGLKTVKDVLDMALDRCCSYYNFNTTEFGTKVTDTQCCSLVCVGNRIVSSEKLVNSYRHYDVTGLLHLLNDLKQGDIEVKNFNANALELSDEIRQVMLSGGKDFEAGIKERIESAKQRREKETTKAGKVRENEEEGTTEGGDKQTDKKSNGVKTANANKSANGPKAASKTPSKAKNPRQITSPKSDNKNKKEPGKKKDATDKTG